MTKKIITVLIIMTLAAGVLSACAEKEVKTLKIGSMPTLSGAIYAVGASKGFFEEAGVNVDLTVFRSAVERDAAATSGNLDGFMTDMMGAVNLYQKDFPFIMTSAEYEDFAMVSMVKPDDIEKTAISENTIIEFIYDDLQEKPLGEKVNVLAVPDRMAAVMSGEVDAGIFPQPFIGIIGAQGGTQIFSTIRTGLMPVVVVFDKDLVDEDPATVEAFYEGYSKTIDYMKTSDYNDYKAALVEYGLATEETVDNLRLPVAEFGMRAPDEVTYDRVLAWMDSKGFLDEVIDFDAISTDTFIVE